MKILAGFQDTYENVHTVQHVAAAISPLVVTTVGLASSSSGVETFSLTHGPDVLVRKTVPILTELLNTLTLSCPHNQASVTSKNTQIRAPTSARIGCGAWRRVVGRDGIVDIDKDARVGSRVDAWNLDLAGRIPGPCASRDGDLRAGEIELGSPYGFGHVQGQMLRPDDVVAIRQAGRDLNADDGVPYMWRREWFFF